MSPSVLTFNLYDYFIYFIFVYFFFYYSLLYLLLALPRNGAFPVTEADYD